MQGLNIRFEIIRFSYENDDEVGGAVVTGSVICCDLRGRIQASIIDDQLLMANPGLETDKIYTVTMQPGSQDIRERDYFRLTYPTNHVHYNEDMRIIKVIPSNFVPSDPRDYMILKLSRSERSHAVQ